MMAVYGGDACAFDELNSALSADWKTVDYLPNMNIKENDAFQNSKMSGVTVQWFQLQ